MEKKKTKQRQNRFKKIELDTRKLIRLNFVMSNMFGDFQQKKINCKKIKAKLKERKTKYLNVEHFQFI